VNCSPVPGAGALERINMSENSPKKKTFDLNRPFQPVTFDSTLPKDNQPSIVIPVIPTDLTFCNAIVQPTALNTSPNTTSLNLPSSGEFKDSASTSLPSFQFRTEPDINKQPSPFYFPAKNNDNDPLPPQRVNETINNIILETKEKNDTEKIISKFSSLVPVVDKTPLSISNPLNLDTKVNITPEELEDLRKKKEKADEEKKKKKNQEELLLQQREKYYNSGAFTFHDIDPNAIIGKLKETSLKVEEEKKSQPPIFVFPSPLVATGQTTSTTTSTASTASTATAIEATSTTSFKFDPIEANKYSRPNQINTDNILSLAALRKMSSLGDPTNINKNLGGVPISIVGEKSQAQGFFSYCDLKKKVFY
jgi:hypothetical protein